MSHPFEEADEARVRVSNSIDTQVRVVESCLDSLKVLSGDVWAISHKPSVVALKCLESTGVTKSPSELVPGIFDISWHSDSIVPIEPHDHENLCHEFESMDRFPEATDLLKIIRVNMIERIITGSLHWGVLS